jgi:hypothetical protein
MKIPANYESPRGKLEQCTYQVIRYEHCWLAVELIIVTMRVPGESCTVKGSRREVSFDSQNGKYASQLSCDASPEVYL